MSSLRNLYSPLASLAHSSHLLAVILRRALIVSGLSCRIALQIYIYIFPFSIFSFFQFFYFDSREWKTYKFTLYFISNLNYHVFIWSPGKVLLYFSKLIQPMFYFNAPHSELFYFSFNTFWNHKASQIFLNIFSRFMYKIHTQQCSIATRSLRNSLEEVENVSIIFICLLLGANLKSY